MYKPIDYALQAVDRGYFVNPACVPRITEPGCFQHAECNHPGKVPVFKHTSCVNSVEDVKRIWGNKDYNILVKTQQSKLIILDYDIHPDKPEGAMWIRRNGSKLNTRQHRTGSGGTHYVYRVANPDIVSHGNRLCRGLDLRGTCANHYVIWIGSRHENGRFYEVIDDTIPEEIPDWIIQEITTTRAKFNPEIVTPFGETIIEQLYAASNLPVLAVDNRRNTVKTWIPCLLEAQHSGKRNPYDCVLMSGVGIGRWGSYVCQHQSHPKITTQKAIQLLKNYVPENTYNEIVGKYKRDKRDNIYNIRTVEDCTKQIEDLFSIIDEKKGKIVVVQVTTGIGKTHGAIRYLARNGHIPTNLFVPTHVLASEFTERLHEYAGIQAAHPRGVGNFKDDEACVFPKMVEEAARLKLPIRQTVCIKCPHFNNYRDSGEKCKAGNSSTPMTGKHRVLQHSTLDAVLREASDFGGNRLLIVDEQPELVTTQALDLSIFKDPETFELYGMEDNNIARYRQLAMLIYRASKIFDNSFATAKDVVSVGKNGANLVFKFDDTSIDLLQWIVDNELPYPYDAAAHLAKRITLGFSDAVGKLKRLADVFTMLYSLRTACTYANRETFQFKNGMVILRVPATWIVEANRYARKGGTVLIMSASANVDVLRETLGDEVTEFLQIHALDGSNIVRAYRYDKLVSRKALCSGGMVNQGAVRGALNRIYDDLGEFGNVQTALLITHKPVADKLRNNPSDYLPPGWIRQIEAGGSLAVEHYGNIVGLDKYKDVDAVITMGDPIPNIDVVFAESRALGVRQESYLQAKVQGESLQAQGRIRACRRDSNGLILHVGMKKPDISLDPNWSRWILPDIEL